MTLQNEHEAMPPSQSVTRALVELRAMQGEIDREIHLASDEAHMRWRPLEVRVERALSATDASSDALRELLEETRALRETIRRRLSSVPPKR